MPFVTGRTGPSASPILPPRKGILALRHDQATKINGGSGLSVAADTGAVATQALINPTYGPRGLRLLVDGATAEETLAGLLADDRGREHRQVHVVDRSGLAAAFTGSACRGWAGHRIGAGVSVAGNLLAGADVVEATLTTFQRSTGPFPERLMAAMQAGQDAGGDQRGQQSAAILIFGTEEYPDLSLRVDEHATPLIELRRIYELWLLEFAAARTFMATRADPTGVYDDTVIEAEVQRRLADPRARVFPV